VTENSPDDLSPVMDALVQVSFAVVDLLSRSAAEFDLSVTQLRLIGILRDRSPSMAALADYLGLDRSSVSGLIDRAERRGLVARRTSEDDARVTLIDLAPGGRDVSERLEATVSTRIEHLLENVAPSERDGFVRISESLLRAAASRG
jgi:MarR family transcriptional regulator, lower aerobic nicotinate degradation pathway regulator